MLWATISIKTSTHIKMIKYQNRVPVFKNIYTEQQKKLKKCYVTGVSFLPDFLHLNKLSLCASSN